MMARGQLPGVIRIGRRVLVRADELVDWLDQKRVPSLAGATPGAGAVLLRSGTMWL